ncbi:MAG: response regulator transcription factor [Chitinophagales bacterium]|nr:response regulator transcription factor [Chitinophagales bacterium]
MNKDLKYVGVIEDNPHLLKNVESFLNVSSEYFVVFSESSIETLDIKSIETEPDFILLDIYLNGTNSIVKIRELKKRFPAAMIIMMTGDKDDANILRAIQQGAVGYLHKPFLLTDLITVLKQTAEKHSYLEGETLIRLMKVLSGEDTKNKLQSNSQLTQRERDIINLLGLGYSYKMISDELRLSYHTVNFHIKNIYIKLDVNSKSELIAKHLLNTQNSLK